MKIHLIIYILLIFSSVADAQNNRVLLDKQSAEIELSAINKRYREVENYSVNVTYKSFVGHTSVDPYDILNGKVKCSKKATLFIMDHTITFANDSIKVILDSIDKVILIENISAVEQDLPGNSIYAGLLKECESIYKSTNGDVITYRLIFKDKSRFEKVDLYAQKTTGLFKIDFYLSNEITVNKDNPDIKAKPKLEISYDNYSSGSVLESKMFDVDYFLILSGAQYKASQNYKGYSVHDSRITN